MTCGNNDIVQNQKSKWKTGALQTQTQSCGYKRLRTRQGECFEVNSWCFDE